MRNAYALRAGAALFVLTLLVSCELVSGVIGGGPTLAVTPTSVDLGAVATGDTNAESVTVENLSGSASTIDVSVDRAWLSVSSASFGVPAGGSESIAITGTCDPSLEGTSASGTVSISDGSMTVSVQVEIACFPSGDLVASPSTAYLSGEAGDTPTLSLVVANTTGSALSFTVENVPAFLDVTPTADSVNANDSVTLTLVSTAPCTMDQRIQEGTFEIDSAGGTLVVDAFEICAAPPVHDYNVDIRFFGDGFDAAAIAAFLDAAERWEAIITDDLEDRTGVTTNEGDCSGPGFPDEPGLDDVTIDDLLIYAGLSAIDGEFGVVGSAGPCILRLSGSADPNLPAYGTAFFDTADAQRLLGEGRFGAVVTHEMGHAIGIGTLWDNLSLIDFQPDSADCRLTGSFSSGPSYTGAAGIAAYEALTGTSESAVPVEDEGGPGTQCGHWEEEIFGDELMTGTLDNAGDPISALTGESLIDLGYATDPNGYDAYSLPPCSPSCLVTATHPEEATREILLFPRYGITPEGSIEPL